MKKTSILFSFMSILPFFACNEKRCKDLPEYFESIDNAVREIKNGNFSLVDSIEIANGQSINNAVFYSCDKINGYIIYRYINGAESFNVKVPYSVWKELKKSINKEAFYEKEIQMTFPGKILHVVK